MADEDTKVDTKKLDKLIKALKKNKLSNIRIGIFGSNVNRNNTSSKSVANNALIGAVHEFGNSVNPQRSFLRIPIQDNLSSYLEDSGAFDEEVLKEVVNSGTTKPWLQKVAAVAETIVQDGFDSGGFGKWPPSNMDGKTNEQTLVETQQLRNSITTEIKGED